MSMPDIGNNTVDVENGEASFGHDPQPTVTVIRPARLITSCASLNSPPAFELTYDTCSWCRTDPRCLALRCRSRYRDGSGATIPIIRGRT